MIYFAPVVVFLWVFSCLWLYRQGVKDGMAIKNEKPLEPIIQPRPEKLTEKEQQEQDAFWGRYNAILNYDAMAAKESE
jgi:hypothetical protein